MEKLVANADHLREAILLDSRGGYFPQKASCDATCQILAVDKYATLAKQWATSKMLGTTVRHFAEHCVYEFRTMLAHLRKKFHAWQQLQLLHLANETHPAELVEIYKLFDPEHNPPETSR